MRKLLILLPAFIFFACKEQRHDAAALLVLDKASIYNSDSVRVFLSKTPELQSDSSKKLFLSAIDVFRNRQNPLSAIELFVSSLSIYPSATSYYELGNAFLEAKKFDEALKAFKMAEQMNYSPLGNLLFREACCFAMLDSSVALDYVQYAIENGFVDRNKIMKDIHMARFVNTGELVSVYNEAMAGNGDPDEVLWQGYIRDFKKAPLPFVIDSGTFRRLGEPQYITYDYENFVPEMRDGKFSRDVGNQFFYLAKIGSAPAYTTIVYGCQSYESNGAPVYYTLATFNRKGTLLDKKIIAGSKAFDQPFLEAVFKTPSELEIKTYKLIYEKSTENDGFENNPVKERQLQQTQKLSIDANGKIIGGQTI
jgi:hypothetical protein